MFRFSISRYRGLSGNHGNSRSWKKVGTTTRERNKGQYSSWKKDMTSEKDMTSIPSPSQSSS